MNRNRIITVVFLLCIAAPVRGEKLIVVAEKKEWPRMEILKPYLESHTNYDMQIVDQPDFPDDLTPYDAAIMYVHGDLRPSIEKALLTFAKSGKRLIVLHHGISSAKRKNETWLQTLGIYLGQNDDPYPYSWKHDVNIHFVNLQPDHYITSHDVTYEKTVKYTSSDLPSVECELPAIEFINSEVFLNYQFTDARAKTVLFGLLYTVPETGNVYMQDRAGWYKPLGKGWVFSFQPGHMDSDFERESYCQIICNCLTWKP
ncbi:MAG: hypothetical protein C4527_09120 [Candidatus Omnitrophota bacterium]|jgi:hypothetical protein|nr:MAG: hypothetical protein C4527_09120 [Candidatus Omnitrophota bacterium]